MLFSWRFWCVRHDFGSTIDTFPMFLLCITLLRGWAFLTGEKRLTFRGWDSWEHNPVKLWTPERQGSGEVPAVGEWLFFMDGTSWIFALVDNNGIFSYFTYPRSFITYTPVEYRYHSSNIILMLAEDVPCNPRNPRPVECFYFIVLYFTLVSYFLLSLISQALLAFLSF